MERKNTLKNLELKEVEENQLTSGVSNLSDYQKSEFDYHETLFLLSGLLLALNLTRPLEVLKFTGLLVFVLFGLAKNDVILPVQPLFL